MISFTKQSFQKLGAKKQLYAVLLLTISVFILTLGYKTYEYNNEYKNFKKEIVFENFFSDFSYRFENPLFSKNIFKRKKFVAYGEYKKFIPAEYNVELLFKINKNEKGKLSFDVASDKGRVIIFKSEPFNVSADTLEVNFRLKIEKYMEIEPRVLINHGNYINIKVEKIIFKKINPLIPFRMFLLHSLKISFFSTLFFLSLLFSIHYHEKKLIFFSNLFLFFLSLYHILLNNWISEDAFITLRHVSNFLKGYGPVYNVGERVEGFTHALWFFVLSFFKYIGISFKGSAVLPGIIFSMVFIYLILYKLKFGKNRLGINFLVPILLGTSAFIDFSTSGLETSLSFLLLSIYVYFVSENLWVKKPLIFGFILSLLFLNRPDFGIFLLISTIAVYFKFLNTNGLKKSLKIVLGFIIFTAPYQIFRMGYYASLFPNPFFTKSATMSNWRQGFLYLKDFYDGSQLLIFLIIFFLTFIYLILKKDPYLYERFFIAFSGLLYGFFVIRGGGDFMHGRFLLPSFILLTLSLSNSFSLKKKSALIVLLIYLSLFHVSLKKLPVQKYGIMYNKGGISDERYTYYHGEKSSIGDVFKDNTVFMWKIIGKNYNNLSKKTNIFIKIAYKNVGFLGFYAGSNVYVLDKLGLTDPVVARMKLKKRGRPGHEKHAPFGYLIYKKLTFSRTPFALWNKIAYTKFGVLWDISPKTLRRFRFFLKKDFKKNIDTSIKQFLKQCISIECKKKNSDFLFFLKNYWVKYADNEGKKLFSSVYDKSIILNCSPQHRWINKNRSEIRKLEKRIRGKLTVKKFFENILYSIRESFFLRFSPLENIRCKN